MHEDVGEWVCMYMYEGRGCVYVGLCTCAGRYVCVTVCGCVCVGVCDCGDGVCEASLTGSTDYMLLWSPWTSPHYTQPSPPDL